jgi:hypothetical protein
VTIYIQIYPLWKEAVARVERKTTNGMNADTVRHYTRDMKRRVLAENASARVTSGDVVKRKRDPANIGDRYGTATS